MGRRQPLAEPIRISAGEARARLEQGEAVFVDVRSAEEYANGHIPGALWAPLNRLRVLLAKLPRDRTIIFY